MFLGEREPRVMRLDRHWDAFTGCADGIENFANVGDLHAEFSNGNRSEFIQDLHAHNRTCVHLSFRLVGTIGVARQQVQKDVGVEKALSGGHWPRPDRT